MRWLAAIGLMAGCDLVIGLDRPESTTSDPRVECGTPAVDDAFENGPPCQPWGSVTAVKSTATYASGELVIAPQAQQGATFAGCTHITTAALGDAGVTLEVSRALSTESGFVSFVAYPRVDTQARAAIVVEHGRLGLYATEGAPPVAARTYTPAMRFWRIRADPFGAGMIGEYSDDGDTYTLLGLVPGEIPSEVRPSFGAGNAASEASPGTAAFASYRVCTLTSAASGTR